MRDNYVTNPSVRALLAQEIVFARQQFARHVAYAPQYRDAHRLDLQYRIQAYRLFAIGVEWALRSGKLKPMPDTDALLSGVASGGRLAHGCGPRRCQRRR